MFTVTNKSTWLTDNKADVPAASALSSLSTGSLVTKLRGKSYRLANSFLLTLISAIGNLWHKNCCKFEASQNYTLSSRPAWANFMRPCLQRWKGMSVDSGVLVLLPEDLFVLVGWLVGSVLDFPEPTWQITTCQSQGFRYLLLPWALHVCGIQTHT